MKTVLTSFALVLGIVVLQGRAIAGPDSATQPVTDEQVREAIRRGVDYLWSKWNPRESYWEPQRGGQFHGGYTAPALLAPKQANVSAA